MSYLQILFLIIALFSIITNTMVCILFLRNRAWLKKPYNVFILSLAITDMITGFLMFMSPGLIFKEPVKIPNISFLGSLYCKVLWTRWLLFALGAVSVYTCLALTIERWTAICRPFNYRARFVSKRLIGYIFLTWIIAFIVSSIGLIESTYQPATSNSTRPSCKITPLVKGNLIGVVSTISVSLKFLFPSLAILGLYAYAIRKLIQRKKRNVQNQRDEVLKNVTKMAAVASITLIVCWTPNQIYFILHKYREVKLFTTFHNILSFIVFLNSTLNPFIYALWGKHFRTGIKAIFGCSSEDVRETDATCPARAGMERNYLSTQSNTTEETAM